MTPYSIYRSQTAGSILVTNNNQRLGYNRQKKRILIPQEPYIDDGTRIICIIGCEYRLLESQILDWLSLFGEVISEITEEPFEDDDEQGSGEKMPTIGNGTYLVKMKLKRDMPNWVPMYGRKVCFSYRGIKKQCNSCFGPHLRKYCKNEKMSLEEYAEKFRIRNQYVPEQLYGKLAKIENIAEQQRKKLEKDRGQTCQQSGSGSGSGANRESSKTSTLPEKVSKPLQINTSHRAPEQLKVVLRRSGGDNWATSKESLTKTDLSPNPRKMTGSNVSKPTNLPSSSMAENVNSFLNGIRASFRSDNVIVVSPPKKSSSNREKI